MPTIRAEKVASRVSLLSPPPGVLQLADELLTYRYVRTLRGEEARERGRRVTVEKVSCFELVEDEDNVSPPQLVFPAGFRHRFFRELRTRGYRVDYEDLRPHPRPQVFEPHWERLEGQEFRWRQREVLEAMVKSSGGQIICPTGYGKSFLIAMICRLWPKARIDIATHAKDVVEMLYDDLRGHVPSVGLIHSSKKYNKDARVRCFSGKSVHKTDGKADVLIVDECITGDAEVSTPSGPVLLRDIQPGSLVMCYDGQNIVARPVLRTWSRGVKPVLRITLESGQEIRCTENHPIATTEGWILAGQLNGKEKVLVESCEDSRNGEPAGNWCEPRCRCVSAVAVSRCDSNTETPWRGLSRPGGLRGTGNIFGATGNNQRTTGWPCVRKSGKRFWEHYWETLPSVIRTQSHDRRESVQITEHLRKLGQGIKPSSSLAWSFASTFSQIPVTGKHLYAATADACRHSLKSMTLCDQGKDRNKSPSPGCSNWAGLGWLGGCATTEECPKTQCCPSTQKATTPSLSRQRLTGFGTTMAPCLSVAEGQEVSYYAFSGNAETIYATKSANISPTAWPISAVSLSGIERLPEGEDVYDLEVEDCHNFFANGLLVHNCHEWATDDYIFRIVRYYPLARRYGFTANQPEDRTDGMGFELEGVLGPPLIDIDYQSAVEKDCVVDVRVRWLDMTMAENPIEDVKNDVARARHGIWRNSFRNQRIADVARQYSKQQVLIVVDTVEHACYLKKHLPEFELCYSEVGLDAERRERYVAQKLIPADMPLMTSVRRQQLKKDFETGKLRKVIATSIWNRGVNFRKLSVLIRADAKATAISDVQISGRLSRLSDDKPYGLLIDCRDQFDHGYQKKALTRRRNYAKMGWKQTYDPTPAEQAKKRLF